MDGEKDALAAAHGIGFRSFGLGWFHKEASRNTYRRSVAKALAGPMFHDGTVIDPRIFGKSLKLLGLAFN
jgi:hypothetical protein